MTLYGGKALCSFKKSKYSSMFLWCRNISFGSGTLGTILDGFMLRLMPSWRSSMGGPYILSALTESSGFSGKLRIVPSCN